VEVVRKRKSIAVEVNYALRFTSNEKVAKFVFEVAEEVERRMNAAGLKGSKVSVSVMRKHPEAEEAEKYLVFNVICSNSTDVILKP
jgi:DNA repair protein REV1